ncbi:pyridoxal-dependent decarboxylase, exosortase A system-associated [Sphingomonas sp. HMP6]|uniref:pyridoxal-dependent decarboxylase, exosortase A system-associated n=1 Tax=Sphingomonas sp. HMP6 TaxID=1517551 RepID=UPI001596D709|nr:pyridoxal-dependent decarboxylase, exosortase A system-associated [Sphingomonas sp. HMP6]BCA57851.1 diaminopimelate decarboxylase [Sphingomonas sp. HMP6]
MKPMGTIPAAFAHAPLVIAGENAEHWAKVAGDTPLFVYDFGVISARIGTFRAAMPERVKLHYAIKANPFASLLDAIAPLVDGLDVASGGELGIALRRKPAAAISFAGPGKRDDELTAAIEAGATINLESEGEWRRARAIGDRLGIRPRVAVRVNPDFELRGSGMRMGGRATPFGVDADRAASLIESILTGGADWQGLHIFAGSQTLDVNALIDALTGALALAERLADQVGTVPQLTNLGGGFGIPYFPGEMPIDVMAIGAALGEAIEQSPLTRADGGFAIELGRWLVGESGVYLTRIVDRKESRGETFLVTDGGMNHQLAASGNLGTVVKRNYPVAIASAAPDAATETVSVVGPLCTPLDRLGDRVTLPVAQAGDLVAVFMAGAYGLSASPTGFLGHPAPRELLVGTHGG